MFSSRAGKDSAENQNAEGSSSPRTIAIKINQLEKELSEALGVLLAKKQLLVNEEYMLPVDEGPDQDGSYSDQKNENQCRREYLNSEIDKLETEMVNLRSLKIAEYLKMDKSIGTKHLADIEKMKKAALPYSKVKVSSGIDLRLSIKNLTKSPI